MGDSTDLPGTIGATELSRRLESGEPLQLVDIREPWEARIASIEGSELIPLGQLLHSLERIRTDVPVVLYCHHGVRTQRALALLQARGYQNVEHLAGGIASWTDLVDDGLARY